MTHESHFPKLLAPREPRARFIGRFIEHWLDGAKDKQGAYADEVRAIYFAHNPDPADRRIKFFSTDDALHDLRENRQVVMRRLRGEIKFEADFEEAAVLALPTGPRQSLLRQLSARYGLLAVPIPEVAGAGASNLAKLCKEFAEAVEAYGPLLDGDGQINAQDSTVKLLKALAETDDLLGVVTSHRAAICSALDAKGVLHA